jgi:hypothetical protein
LDRYEHAPARVFVPFWGIKEKTAETPGRSQASMMHYQSSPKRHNALQAIQADETNQNLSASPLCSSFVLSIA